jgi:hypothetical protein
LTCSKREQAHWQGRPELLPIPDPQGRLLDLLPPQASAFASAVAFFEAMA